MNIVSPQVYRSRSECPLWTNRHNMAHVHDGLCAPAQRAAVAPDSLRYAVDGAVRALVDDDAADALLILRAAQQLADIDLGDDEDPAPVPDTALREALLDVLANLTTTNNAGTAFFRTSHGVPMEMSRGQRRVVKEARAALATPTDPQP